MSRLILKDLACRHLWRQLPLHSRIDGRAQFRPALDAELGLAFLDANIDAISNVHGIFTASHSACAVRSVRRRKRWLSLTVPASLLAPEPKRLR